MRQALEEFFPMMVPFPLSVARLYGEKTKVSLTKRYRGEQLVPLLIFDLMYHGVLDLQEVTLYIPTIGKEQFLNQKRF